VIIGKTEQRTGKLLKMKKIFLYLVCLGGVIFLLISRSRDLGNTLIFVDISSLLFILLPVLLTGVNYKLIDVILLLFFPFNRQKILEKGEYYLKVLKYMKKNFILFSTLFVLVGIILTGEAFLQLKKTELCIWIMTYHFIPLFYTLLLFVFVIVPIETAIEDNLKTSKDSNENEEKNILQ